MSLIFVPTLWKFKWNMKAKSNPSYYYSVLVFLQRVKFCLVWIFYEVISVPMGASIPSMNLKAIEFYEGSFYC